MADSDKPPSLQELGRRIKKVRHEAGLDEPERPDGGALHAQGLSAAWRISIELVTAVVVSTGLGWVFDQWFGTTPWLMLVFLVLGMGAGVANAVRTAIRMDSLSADREQKTHEDAARGQGHER